MRVVRSVAMRWRWWGRVAKEVNPNTIGIDLLLARPDGQDALPKDDAADTRGVNADAVGDVRVLQFNDKAHARLFEVGQVERVNFHHRSNTLVDVPDFVSLPVLFRQVPGCDVRHPSQFTEESVVRVLDAPQPNHRAVEVDGLNGHCFFARRRRSKVEEGYPVGGWEQLEPKLRGRHVESRVDQWCRVHGCHWWLYLNKSKPCGVRPVALIHPNLKIVWSNS